MKIRVLGTAAGGGFPQWNCSCPNCSGHRDGTLAAHALLQSSLAISPNEKDWYLVNAGPDVRMQIESFSALHPGPGIRKTPLRGVILTDAELDHTIGLLSLREGSSFTIYGTEAVRNSLQSAFPVFPMLKNYCSWEWQSFDPDHPSILGDPAEEAMTMTAVPVSKKPPLYARTHEKEVLSDEIWEVGLVLHNENSGRTLAYFPTLENVTPAIEEHLQKADILMVDGTFWSKNELVEMGATERGADRMGHLPIGGEAGTAEKLSALPAERKIFIHINNSNPILREDSTERRELERLGFEVAFDGLEVEV
ncbi:MAG TPA: pyrroloquinoline quinone biosynthesis protein PqqB [Bacillales bacterium]|nr:pyrroloquinoline quinone biosynthesis protein PqqB [Bacillales bacterium]